MRLLKRGLLWGLAMIASTALPIRAEEPVNRSIRMPARELYRKPYDTADGGMTRDPEFQRHVIITVSPATFPYPLLKYRFNTYSTELESGNAAPLYSQAWAEFERIYAEAEKNWYASNECFELKKSGASEDRILGELFRAVPLGPAWANNSYPKRVSPEEEAKFYESMKPVYQLLEKASRMRNADWSYCMEDKGIATSLDHIQYTRGLARYLSGKANWEIRNGKYEDAVKTLRIGIVMGNHVAKANSPSLIDTFVGIAIHGIMQAQIMTLASQPDAPNLYPALTQIILPADTFQYAMQGEQFFPFPSPNAMPIFENIDKASPEECRDRLANVVASLLQMQSNQWGTPPEKSTIAAAITVVCTLCYPQGRDRLLAQGGKAEDIEKLSVYQVVTPYVLEEIKAAYDRLLVAATFPAGSSHTAVVSEEQLLEQVRSPVDSYLMLLLPALNAGKTACTRQYQTYELLKIIEAIRYYAAVHGGKLPESLGAIKEIPVATVDPMTGKPLGYKVEGRTAIIDYTHVGKCRLEITVQETAAQRKAGK
ncbi:MAG: hypothetical protein ACLP9L_25235 [Thermoguttaceae bacterium]